MLVMNEHAEFVDVEMPRRLKLDGGTIIGTGRHEKTCPHCFTRFKTDAPTKVYCSDRCRDEENSGEVGIPRREDGRIKGICAWCGGEFFSRSTKRLYCSKKCKSASNKQSARERAKRQEGKQ